MNHSKKTYLRPTVEKVLMDNDISLALESPWGDPAPMFSVMEFSPEVMPVETIMPGL